MEEIELGEQNEKEESDRFVEWAVVNGLRLPTESAQLWWDSHQAQAQLQFICCRDSEISLHVGYSEGEEPKAISWFHATAPHDLYRVQWSTDVVLFIERSDQPSPARLSITWPLLHHLASSWVITARLFPMLVSQSFKTRRDSGAGIISQHISGEKEREFCLSVYHCQKLGPRNAGETTRWVTHRVVVYNQAIHKYSRWILIGPGYLNQLQRGLLNGPWSPFKNDSRYLGHSVPILIAYVLACSWQSMLTNIEDQIILEDSRAENDRPINVLYELQNQISLACWQIETNIGVLKFIMDIPEQEIVQDQFEYFFASLENLIRQKARVEFLSRETRNAIEQASQDAGQVHTVKMETFSWHNLKMNYAIESGTRQTTIICLIIAPAIFTSTFFSTNFFSLTEDGATFTSQSIWIWFSIAIPLTASLFLLVWLSKQLRTRQLVRGSLSEKFSTIFV